MTTTWNFYPITDQRQPPDLIPIHNIHVVPFSDTWNVARQAASGQLDRSLERMDASTQPGSQGNFAPRRGTPTHSLDYTSNSIENLPHPALGMQLLTQEQNLVASNPTAPRYHPGPVRSNSPQRFRPEVATQATPAQHEYQNAPIAHTGHDMRVRGLNVISAYDSPTRSPRGIHVAGLGDRVQYSGSNSSLPISEL